MRTLVLGGIRSGKSCWAETAISALLAPDQPVRYLATGSVEADATFSRRVAEHRDRRPAHWATVETCDLATQLRHTPNTPTLIDDVGGWLTAMLDRRRAWENGSVSAEIDGLLDAVASFDSTLMLVSPEVGLTVVPATGSGRRFADELGTLNRRLAAVCEQVVLVVAGQPVPIKPAAPR